jgi:phosphatidylserine decarboxylase
MSSSLHITNKISQIFGKFASKKFSKPIQSIINNGYVKILGLNMDEFNMPSSYGSLNELFTRELVKPRDIDTSSENFISPADSFVTEAGKLDKDRLLQIKGMSYSIDGLLTEHISSENRAKTYDGEFMNFYLSPKDYHRYHAPYTFKVNKLIHVPGKLYPVNIPYLKKEQDLFIKNERVIIEAESNGKIFYLVYVGALNVGEMVFTFEPRVETNKDVSEIKVYEYNNLVINKGDCMGYFKMGSTVLMMWEKDMVELKNLVNHKVSFGTIVTELVK